MKIIYPAVFKKFSGTEQGYSVLFPDLPGCVTEGASLEEAMEMAVDAASGWILTSMEDDEKIPSPSNIFDIKANADDEFINYVVLDMAEYAKQHSNKSVKKTLTIPSWLNYMAERAEVNFSQLLQKALRDTLNLTPDIRSETAGSINIKNEDDVLFMFPELHQ